MTDETFKLITREMAAEILSVSLTTLDALVASGAVPAPKPLGDSRRLYWLPETFKGHLRRLLGDKLIGDSKPQTDPATDCSPLAHDTDAPVRLGVRRKITKPGAQKSLRSKKIERLNQ
jgi:hypothetical protein